MGQNIINLYKQFDKYKYVSNDTIYYKILPSLRLNQYKTDHKTYFYNWAYLNDKAEKEYIEQLSIAKVKTNQNDAINCYSGSINNLELILSVIIAVMVEVAIATKIIRKSDKIKLLSHKPASFNFSDMIHPDIVPTMKTSPWAKFMKPRTPYTIE